ncbi:MAG: response regulator transcription factor [Pseudobutyrivibrio sp.]|nr:response regulator transcription factor [Pseudobutyrivibrio sp.]
MTIAICDDEKPVRDLLTEYVKEVICDATLLQFSSGEKLLESLREAKSVDIDILLLDIAMAGLDGMAVADTLQQAAIQKNISPRVARPLVIFVTGMEDKISEAFGVSAFNFVTKPIDKDKFHQIIKRAADEVKRIEYVSLVGNTTSELLTIKSGAAIYSINPDDIYLVESIGRKIVVHLVDKDIEAYGKISELEQILGKSFFRVHKSYLVNMMHIKKYTRTDVTLSNGAAALLSKYRYNDFVTRYMNYIADREI